ncbi:hypothetical protein DV736_g893, partial [Chaetothyriales sp. CBS 134916]
MPNPTLFQAWEWYAPADGQHWARLGQNIPELKALGIDRMWLPPGCKAGWEGSNGYDVYDLYDLGEFDQKGGKCTKWGPKEALIDMARLANKVKIGLLWDAVLNHKSAADYTEKCLAVIVDKNDRLKDISPIHEVEVWTGYDFSGRKGKYSTFRYHWHHFSGTDWEAALKTNDSLYKFVGPGKPGWAPDVDNSFGNSDYLMGNDLDYSQQEVRDDIHAWGEWVVKEVGLSGFRLDAVKHFSQHFLKEWIQRLDSKFPGRRLFHVGEYWRPDINVLRPVIELMEGRLSLFDVPLACNMSKVAASAPDADLRQIFHGTLAKHYPAQAVRDHEVDPIPFWFVPLGYALILLRANVGYPCVFYGDLYGISGHRPQPPQPLLPRLMMARKLYAYELSLSKLLCTLDPMLDDRTFVFITLSPQQQLDPLPIPCSDLQMTFREKEGLTIVTTLRRAEEHGFNYSYRSKMITLNVHSSLEAVGFMKVISTALADEGLSSNPVSAYYHDHIFVKEEVAEKAVKVLNSIADAFRAGRASRDA